MKILGKISDPPAGIEPTTFQLPVVTRCEVQRLIIPSLRPAHHTSFFFCNLFIFLQQHDTVLRIHYLQSLNLQKATQYLQYITYSNLLTIHVTVLTIYYLKHLDYCTRYEKIKYKANSC